MKIDTKKLEVLELSRENANLNMMIGGEQIKHVKHFQYRGLQINAENNQESEINNKKYIYISNLMALYPILCTGQSYPSDTKLIIYTTILRPILLYGSKVWTLTQRTKSKLQATELKYYG